MFAKDEAAKKALTSLIKNGRIHENAIYGLLQRTTISANELGRLLPPLAALDAMPSIGHMVERLLTLHAKGVRGLRFQLQRARELHARFGVADVGRKIPGQGFDIDVLLLDGSLVEIKWMGKTGKNSNRRIYESMLQLSKIKKFTTPEVLVGLSLRENARVGETLIFVTNRPLSSIEQGKLERHRKGLQFTDLRTWRRGQNYLATVAPQGHHFRTTTSPHIVPISRCSNCDAVRMYRPARAARARR
jgi:hypothetical protein